MSTVLNAPTQNDVGNAPAEGVITDEAIADARAMIGLHLRPEGPYLQDATADTMRNWCNGIGDLNPLYRDIGYGAATRYGSMLAHPMFPMAFGWLGRTRWGLPGVHGFYAGNDWELFRHVRPGDRISAIERVVGVEEKQSKFSGRLVMQYVEACYYNQRGELVARGLGTCTRHERKAARDTGKYKEIEQYQYTNEEHDRIDQIVLDEPKNIRGSAIRYWEDVKEGEELPDHRARPAVADGHHGLPGRLRPRPHARRGAAGGCQAPRPLLPQPGSGRRRRIHRHRPPSRVGRQGSGRARHLRLRPAALLVDVHAHHQLDGRCGRHQARAHRDAALQHHGRHDVLQGQGRAQVRQGQVALVDIEIAAENQRGEVTTPGLATVALPSRDVKLPAFIDGSGVDLELPVIR